MDQFGIGLVMLVAGVIGFWLARPRDGQVVSFLKQDSVQAYYVVALLGATSVGALLVFLGLRSLLN
jgi:hypothetical protein